MCHSSVPPRYFGIGAYGHDDGYEYEMASNSANRYSSIVSNNNNNNNKTSYASQNKTRNFTQSQNNRDFLDRSFNHLEVDNLYRFSDSD